MKFSCTQENINRALNIVSHLTSKNINLPILNNVLLKASDRGIELLTTNLEESISVTIRGKIEEPGEFTIPVQIFSNYINLLSSEKVDFVLENNKEMLVTAKNQKTKIKGEKAEDFPLVPEIEKNQKIIINSGELKQALSGVLIATVQDESRPELTGVLFDLQENKLTLAATDSYRLAEKKIVVINKTNTKTRTILPANALREVVRCLPEEEEVLVCFADNQVLFETKETKITSKIIEGNFPDYNQIIPKVERTKIIVDKNKMIKATKAASLFSRMGVCDINLHFSPEKHVVTLTTINNQLGENVTKIEAEITGDSNNTIFNYRYLLDGLAAVSTEKVVIKLVDNLNPGIFLPHGNEDDYKYIIMPIKQ